MQKFFLTLLVIACVAVVLWTAYLLFTKQTDLVVGIIILLVDIIVLVWNILALRRYRTGAGTIFSIFLVIALLGATVGAFAGVEPLTSYKDKVMDAVKSLTKEVNTTVSPIATVESMGGYLGSYDIWFTVVPQNALPEVPYIAELYERGKLRSTQLVRFSEAEINSGMAKEIRFVLTEKDFVGLFLGSDLSDVFSIKIKPLSTGE